MTPLKKFIIALIFIIVLLSLGTGGYVFIEGWSIVDSLYMSVITISTIGYGEVHPLSAQGKLFTLTFVVISLISIGYILGTVVSFLFEGQFQKTWKERKMKKILAMIKDHFIICGYGDVGLETAEELDRKGIPFVIIDNSMTESELDRHPDYSVIVEDATEEMVLDKARIKKAKGIMSCLPNDQLNVYTVLTARQMNPDLYIVAKASDHRSQGKLLAAGADKVILPKQIAGRRMATVATHPGIIDFLDVLSTGGDGDIRIESVKVVEGSELVHNSLRTSQIGKDTGVLIIGILDRHGKTRKYTDTRQALSSIILEEGDQLIALGNESQLELLHKNMKKKK
ncbi:potassium channel family protein [Spirochaeta cellobiosiphila]|uniref:potassium channel family protein n=1 Tax=Spirochaeta cellobiosiphila TaxID=504483 RepID=UPI000429BD0C|nr:potassium channel protein [Spirochaeta cellobiosiphila]